MNTFGSQSELKAGGKIYEIFRLSALEKNGISLHRLPFSLRILLENLLRYEDGKSVTADDIEFLAKWDPKAEPSREISWMPARVLMQDFTGVPAVVDLAAMRDAMKVLGGDPQKINPLQPAELVIDHSVQVDEYGTGNAYSLNAALEFQRNRERYAFLKWGQTAFRNFSAVPPGMGICHQVNLEYLARVVFTTGGAKPQAYPDTLVGTDSHTTMINGLGVLGWGVGGIEAEAAMLGQPISMLVPQVVGFKLTGKLREGATATDLVLTVTEMLRKLGVVGKFVEFYGPGIAELPLADRATIGNMAPEYGATCGLFPVDAETLRYLRLTGRPADQIALVEAYFKEQGLFHTPDSPEAEYSQTIALDLAQVEPSVAGPRRPQDRVLLREAGASFKKQLPSLLGPNADKVGQRQAIRWEGEGGHASANGNVQSTHAAREPNGNGHIAHTVKERFGIDLEPYLDHGSIVIAAITSCTNTSNPSVMVAAGLLAKKAVEKGLSVPPWVKTSLAPGSRVVTDYYDKSGLTQWLDKLRFNTVGYGCTTCIGNSGPLPDDISKAIEAHSLVAVSVLSGNRNFEGRINSEVRANYLMSPPLVVAYALAGRIDHDFDNDPIGKDKSGQPVFLRDIWPSQQEVSQRHRFRHFLRQLHEGIRHRHPRRRELAEAQLPHRRRLPVGARLHLHPQGAVLRRHARPARARRRKSPMPASSPSSATPSPPTTSRPPAPSSSTAQPENISPTTASNPPTSTPTARAAAITKSWSAAPSPTSACATSWRPAPKAASPASSPKASRCPSTTPR